MWTKRQIIDEAYGELAVQGYVFDVGADERMTAMRRLDSMMATWLARGISIGYKFPADPKRGDPDDLSGIPDTAVETVFLNLAIRLAAGIGKQLSPDTRRVAAQGFDLLLIDTVQPTEQQLPDTLPVGAGNRPWHYYANPFFPTPDALEEPTLTTLPGGLLTLDGAVLGLDSQSLGIV